MIVSNTKYPDVKTEVPGPKSLDLFNEEIKYIAPGIQTIATRSKIAIDKGDGCIVQDVDGNRYIDFFVGVGVASLGYNHPVYNKMMKEQLDNIHVGSFTSQNRVKLTKL
ncbi:MAG TPA: aminotransferase class III-fold pyridoxal phosphate-dependent enzyme, partial [Ignavibacteriaceae bacterium]|nr:aminotransferase class III-fold pyridoxal phosphate-dependent enzyme [Ignavibacteriaceae bacterium]